MPLAEFWAIRDGQTDACPWAFDSMLTCRAIRQAISHAGLPLRIPSKLCFYRARLVERL